MKSTRIFELFIGKSPPGESNLIISSMFMKKDSKTKLLDELTKQINNLDIIIKMN